MEERIYKFVNKKYHVSYMVTKEELDMLNTSYNKEEYCDYRKYKHNNIRLFSEIDTEEYSAEEILEDKSKNTERDVFNSSLMEELFSILSEKEKKVASLLLIEGYKATDLEEVFNRKSHEILRDKKKVIQKLKIHLEKMGIYSLNDALEI